MIRVALVGDRSPAVRAHTRIPGLLGGHDVYWVPTTDVTGEDSLDGFDGIWLVPGSPYRNESGAVTAATIARTRGVPFLGTCGGFQHAMLEYARHVCGLPGAGHDENTPGAGQAVITALACSLAGHQAAVTLLPGSRAATLAGTARTVERYQCSYGLDEAYTDVLRAHAMTFTGTDDDGSARVAELPAHPFWLATLFQPELSGDGVTPHPFIQGFAEATARHATARQATARHAATR